MNIELDSNMIALIERCIALKEELNDLEKNGRFFNYDQVIADLKMARQVLVLNIEYEYKKLKKKEGG